mgnify:CR=1 FL=1
MGIRTNIAGLSRAKLLHTDLNGRMIAVSLHSQQSNIIIIGTYWPSGSSNEALAARADMQDKVQNLIAENHNCILILLGDMLLSLIITAGVLTLMKLTECTRLFLGKLIYSPFQNTNPIQIHVHVPTYSPHPHATRPGTPSTPLDALMTFSSQV